MSPPNATLPKRPTLNPYLLQNRSKSSVTIRTSRNTAPKTTNTESPTVIKPYGSDRVDISALACDPTALEYGTQEAITQKCKEESSEPKEEDGFSWFNNNVLGLFRVSPATERNEIVAFQQRQQTPASNTSSNSFKLFTVA